jgi:hypothetical protein
MSEATIMKRMTLSVSEGKISGADQVFTDRNNLEKLHLSARDNNDGTTDFSLESPIHLDRLAIADTFMQPLDIDASWSDAQKGLRLISYPHRTIQRLSRAAGSLVHLHAVRHDSGALAGAMIQHDVISANMPVFNYGQSRHYAAGRLRELDKDLLRPIIEQLFGISISSKAFRKWTPASWNQRNQAQRDEIIDRFRSVLSGIERSEDSTLSTQDLLDCLMAAEIEELEHLAAEQLFSRYSIENDLARHPDDEYGDPDTDIFVRDSDVPVGAGKDKDTTVVLGRHLDPRSKREPFPRRRVEFWTERQERIVRPILRWRRDDSDGEAKRSFVFGGGESRMVHNDTEPFVAYHSPLAGAAIMASYFGQDVDYSSSLRKYTGESHLSRRYAGFLPVVIATKQSEVLDNAYIRRSERLVETGAH